MAASTTRYGLQKPTVGADADLWGGYLNTDLDDIDAIAGAITTTGSANAYVLTTSLSLAAYVAGQSFDIKANFTNSGAATINVDTLGAKDLRKNGTTALASGDIVSGNIYRISYDGTVFQVLGHVGAGNQPLDAALTAIADASAPSAGKVPLYSSSTAAVMADFLGRNVIINGDFNVWQRGTSFASIAHGAFSADRWLYQKSGTMVHDISRSTDVPTVAQAGRLFNYSILVDCTTADASIAAGDYCILQQKVEGYNWLPLAQRACVVSFWVKATKAGIHCVALANSAGDRTYVGEYTVNASDTWEYKTVTVTASPSAGTWNYVEGVGLSVRFTLAAGSTYQATAGAWSTGDYLGSASQVNQCDSTSNNFRICGVRLEAGSVATLEDARPFGLELAVCRRRYRKSFAYATAPAQNIGTGTGELIFTAMIAGAGSEYSPTYYFGDTMAGTPTITLYNPSAANAQIRNESRAQDCSGSTTLRVNDTGFSLQATGSASTVVGDGLGVHWTAEVEL